MFNGSMIFHKHPLKVQYSETPRGTQDTDKQRKGSTGEWTAQERNVRGRLCLDVLYGLLKHAWIRRSSINQALIPVISQCR